MTGPAASRDLRAGRLSCRLDGTRLVHIRWDGTPVIRMIYAAVRDPDWGTVEPSIGGFAVAEADSGFEVRFDACYRAGAIDFRCRYRFAAAPNGVLAVEMDGHAETAFDYARIGLCILLPWQAYCGKPYRASLDGEEFAGTIPAEIAKQYFRDGCYTPSVPPLTRFETSPAEGLSARFDFEGDAFEMEDQRNWTDSTLKIYSTPLHLGNLHHAEAGQPIRQRLRLRVSGTAPAAEARPQGTPVNLEIGALTGHAVPPIGTTWPRTTVADAALAATPALSHLRFEVDLTDAAEVAAVGTRLPPVPRIELAVWTDEASLARLPDLLRTIGDPSRIARIIVNDIGTDVTEPRLIEAARERASAAGCPAPVGGGTDFWFAEINRVDFDFAKQDFLSLTVTPQLHVFDDESVIEAAMIQGPVVEAARRRVASGHVVLSPITLVPRDSGKVRRGEPQSADPRHETDFLTAWTAASLVSAMIAGAHALTYFDGAGPHGLRSQDAGPLPAYDLLAAFAGRTGRPTSAVSSDNPDSVCAIAVDGGDLAVLVANCTPHRQTVRLEGSVLSETPLRCRSYLFGPGSGTSPPAAAQPAPGPLVLELAAYEVVLLEGRKDDE